MKSGVRQTVYNMDKKKRTTQMLRNLSLNYYCLYP